MLAKEMAELTKKSIEEQTAADVAAIPEFIADCEQQIKQIAAAGRKDATLWAGPKIPGSKMYHRASVPMRKALAAWLKQEGFEYTYTPPTGLGDSGFFNVHW